jgi:acetyltransferase-like isoleucine patch superfamily enzyme
MSIPSSTRSILNWQAPPVPEPEPVPEPAPPAPVHVDPPAPVWQGIPNEERVRMESAWGQTALHTEPLKLIPRTLQAVDDHDRRLFVGRKVELCNTFFNLFGGKVYIYDHAFFGQNCQVLTGSHSSKKKRFERQALDPRRGNDVVIEEGAWIASGVTVIGPCRIGAHAVIAAGSVVLPGDYEGGCMYAGNPAKFKKRIDFDPE